MPLNPAYDTQPSRKLPLAYGYVLGAGDMVLDYADDEGALYQLFLLADGEWDGIEQAAPYDGTHLSVVQGSLFKPNQTIVVPNSYLQTTFRFHSGAWTPKGLGHSPTSVGIAQQAVDGYFTEFPTVTPPQTFSGIAYAVVYRAANHVVFSPTGRVGIAQQTSAITATAVYRTTRVRQFDTNGNVIAYGFSVNPAWHFVDAILRYKIKPQQPPIAGLTAAEKACFDWPSIVATAARNAFILPNGNPRFVGNYIFASDATLTNILETILRVSRSYQRVVGGRISLIGDDARSPVFTLSARHVFPGSLQLSKKDVSKSPNVFVPKYRDLDMPAVCQVTTATWQPNTNHNPDELDFATTGNSPFLAGDLVSYGGGSDPSFVGNYSAGDLSTFTPVTGNMFVISLNNDGSAHTSTGGYLGTNDARFAKRAPTGVRHRSHQLMVAKQAPGLAVQPRVIPVTYDCGNCTFDQANRLMKFERDSSLGPDTGASWTAPIAGTLTAYLESVDLAGNQLYKAEVHDVLALDDWLTPECAGQYKITAKRVNAPTATGLATVEFDLVTYYPSAATDVSDPPGDSYATVPGHALMLSNIPQVVNPAWTLAANLDGVLSGSNWTLTVSGLVMQIGGQPTTTTYPTFTVTVANATNYIVYVDDPTGTGTSATFGAVAGMALASPVPAGRYVILNGTFTTPTLAGGVTGTVQYNPA